MKRSICFIVPLLTSGGAERVILTLSKFLDKSVFDVTLIVLNKRGAFANFQHPGVRLIDLNVSRVLFSGWKLRRVLKDINPDIVMSTLDHLNIYLGLIRFLLPKKTYVIARSTCIARNADYPPFLKWIMSILYRYAYPKLDKIVCQSDEMKDDLESTFNVPAEKIMVIPNPVDVATIHSKIQDDFPYNFGPHHFVAVGRLERIKGYDILLEAMQKSTISDLSLTIIGEGSQFDVLKTLSKQYGLSDRVFFRPFTDNPYVWMYHAKALVLSSRSEGLSNVMLEALSCGTPVISFDNLGGASRIITSGMNGLLVSEGDCSELARALDAACSLTFDRDVIKNSVSSFAVSTVVATYSAVFASKRDR